MGIVRKTDVKMLEAKREYVEKIVCDHCGKEGHPLYDTWESAPLGWYNLWERTDNFHDGMHGAYFCSLNCLRTALDVGVKWSETSGRISQVSSSFKADYYAGRGLVP